MKIGKNNITRTTLALLVTIAILSGIVLAQVLYTVTLTYHISINASGAFNVYEVGTTNTFTGFTFPAFDAVGYQNKSFDIYNTGNKALNIQWNITISGLWQTDGIAGYKIDAGPPNRIIIRMFYAGAQLNYDTNSPTTIAVGSRATMTLRVECATFEALPDTTLLVNIGSV